MLIKYKYQPIEAYQWHKNGDHPRDLCELITSEDGPAFMSEGKVVRYFRHPQVIGKIKCGPCDIPMQNHGFIDQGEAGIVVCPGDWVVNDKDMVYDAYPDHVFKAEFVEYKYSPLEALDKLLSQRCGFEAKSPGYEPCSRYPHTDGAHAHHFKGCKGIIHNLYCDCINKIYEDD